MFFKIPTQIFMQNAVIHLNNEVFFLRIILLIEFFSMTDMMDCFSGHERVRNNGQPLQL